MSLRWRLTLYYTGISAGLLLLGSLVLFLVLRTTLRQTLDDSLREAVALAASELDHDKPRAAGTIELFLTRLPGATVLLVYSAQGALIESYGVPPVRPAPAPGFSTVGNTRIYGEILADGSLVQAMRSELETSRSIGRAQRLLLLTLPLLLLLGLGAGYVLADRALRPVDQVTRLAAQIAASGRYGRRVPESPGKDEMARLTRTFNAMLARLERTIEREKAFALAAAHELRTPLSLLKGRASLSLERPRSPEQYREALAEIARTAEDLAQVIEALLLLAHTQSPVERQQVELDLLALEALESLEGLAKERQVRVVLQLEPTPYRGHSLTLRTAIANLLSNAIKYGPVGGRVWLRTRREGRLAVVEVADEGPGIPPEQLERLLQPFQRGAGTQGVRGAGLGLSLVMAIAEQHGGRLRLERAPEGGLLARLELPDFDAS
ncbi:MULTISPECIES: ATP-binding protein [unclassified Meiothermus]|uniref:HAMP domain-containing sensor histidine kinase n=1 Tax=unclassified Meiothermus TaxID=370471 RepID=UPI000D7BD5BF|nr:MULTISPECIES: ATP-binding protein [unclassified Meiothermus]PZA06675.1 two-component sensor histidine kinase [Meiothermus sp. Pnk-1]RYM29217.1 HAMP domain-containing protein [Meiothermus sp. PNK-Is4]